MNYNNLVKSTAINQGYCLGLEAYHRLHYRQSLANHYLKLAVDFSILNHKIKLRATKNGFNKSKLIEVETDAIQLGKNEASVNVLLNK